MPIARPVLSTALCAAARTTSGTLARPLSRSVAQTLALWTGLNATLFTLHTTAAAAATTTAWSTITLLWLAFATLAHAAITFKAHSALITTKFGKAHRLAKPGGSSECGTNDSIIVVACNLGWLSLLRSATRLPIVAQCRWLVAPITTAAAPVTLGCGRCAAHPFGAPIALSFAAAATTSTTATASALAIRPSLHVVVRCIVRAIARGGAGAVSGSGRSAGLRSRRATLWVCHRLAPLIGIISDWRSVCWCSVTMPASTTLIASPAIIAASLIARTIAVSFTTPIARVIAALDLRVCIASPITTAIASGPIVPRLATATTAPVMLADIRQRRALELLGTIAATFGERLIKLDGMR